MSRKLCLKSSRKGNILRGESTTQNWKYMKQTQSHYFWGGNVMYFLTLNLYIKLDALYMDLDAVNINLDASQQSANAYTVNSFTMHYLDSIN